MKALRIVRFVNLALAGMLAGNEFGTWAAVHPALGDLGPEERVRAEQEITRRYAAIMPVWMGSAVASSVLGRWYRLHTFRISLTTAGLGFLLSGALAEDER